MVQKNKKSKKILIWLIVLIVFVLVGVGVYFVLNGFFNKKEDNVVVSTETVKEEGGKGSVLGEEGVEKEEIVLYEGEDPNENSDLTGVVTYAGVNGDYLMIRVNIDQYLSDGVCELNLLNNGAVMYDDLANITSSVTTSTCEGFNVPMNEIIGGDYQILVTIKSNEKIGTIEGEVNI